MDEPAGAAPRGCTVFGVFSLGVLCAALVFGGSSRADTWSPMIVQLGALPLLGVGLFRLGRRDLRPVAAPLLFLAALAVLAVAQLVPLPPAVWTRLPGHAALAQGYAVLGLTLPWLPISVTPDATLASALAFIPPAAMVCATLTLDTPDRRLMLLGVLAVALAAVLLGLAQMAGGEDSPLRFYPITNPGSAVGFFANRNHQACFLVMALPVAAWWTSHEVEQRRRRLFAAVLGPAFLLVLIVGVAITRSRAGVLLGGLAIGASIALTLRGAPRSTGRARTALLAGAAATAIAMVALLSVAETVQRFESEPLSARWRLTPAFAAIGQSYAPFGSGLGSFETVYEMFEPPDQLDASYLNHAHNDYMEIWVTCGWFGTALAAIFVVGTLRRSWIVWTGPGDRGGWLGPARVGSTIVIIAALHSIGDYPLRSPAVAALFGFACVLMQAPVRWLDVRRGATTLSPSTTSFIFVRGKRSTTALGRNVSN